MPKIKECYRCSTMLATESVKKAKLLRPQEKDRWVEVCNSCWWMLIGGGVQVTGKGRHMERLCVPIEQRDLFEEEKRPAASNGGPRG